MIHAIRESEGEKTKNRFDAFLANFRARLASSKREKFLMNRWENGRENELERE